MESCNFIYDGNSEIKTILKIFEDKYIFYYNFSVLNHGKGVCADPRKRDATLGVGGPGPPERGSEQQLVPDSGGGKA